MTVPFTDYRTPITGFMAALWSLQLKESQGYFLKDFRLIKFAKFTHSLFGGMDGGHWGKEKIMFKCMRRKEKYTIFLKKGYKALAAQGIYFCHFRERR